MAMSSSYCISNESMHKAGQNVSANNVQPSGVKGSCVGFASLSCYPLNTMRWHEICRERGRQVIVASSPPTEDFVIATEPLTKEDLVAYLASGCKLKENWRIGTEHEKFGFESETLRPMKYEQISELLYGISERFDWEKIMEGDNIIGLKQGKLRMSFEPGCQFELSGAPLENLHQTCAEINFHLYQVFHELKPELMCLLLLDRFEQYVDYALDVPMYFVYRNKKYIDCAGLSFRDFLARKLAPVPGEYPNINDWENHLTTLFPEVGILYDEVSLQTVSDMIADWTVEEREKLRNEVPVTGLNTPFRGGSLKDVAQEVMQLAKDGSERRGLKETVFLNEVAEVAETGVTPDEKLLELYYGKWNGSVDPVYQELLYSSV